MKQRIAFFYSTREGVSLEAIRDLITQDQGSQQIVEKCSAFIEGELGWSLMDLLEHPIKAKDLDYWQEPALTTIQIALTEALKSRGIVPNAVGGRSSGEFAAAFAGQLITTEEALRRACMLGQILMQGKDIGHMILIYLSRHHVAKLQVDSPASFHIVADNSMSNTVVACKSTDLETICEYFKRCNARIYAIKDLFGGHSPLLDPLQEPLSTPIVVRNVDPSIPIYSSETGNPLVLPIRTYHWWNVLRNPVYLCRTLTNMIKAGYDTVVDINTRTSIGDAIQEVLHAQNRRVLYIPAMHESFKSFETCCLTLKMPPKATATARSQGNSGSDRALTSSLNPNAPKCTQEKSTTIFNSAFHRDPYPVYRELRDHDPIHFDPDQNAWMITRHADVVQVLRDTDHFSSQTVASFESILLGADPPAHGHARRIVLRSLQTVPTEQLEQMIRNAAQALVANIRKKGRCDLIADLASPLPVYVIANLLGIESDRIKDFKRWSDAMTQMGSSLLSEKEKNRIEDTLKEFDEFFRNHVESIENGQTIRSILTEMSRKKVVDGFTVEELADIGKLLLVAGNETTTNLVGNAMLSLLDHPDALEACLKSPDAIPRMIEETLRYESPVQFTQRLSRKGARIGDLELSPGSRIYAFIGSANRDERKFPSPNKFDLNRHAAGHIAFGSGPHHCIGANLARMESRILFETLFAELPRLRLAIDRNAVTYVPAVQLRGPESLELTFGPTRT